MTNDHVQGFPAFPAQRRGARFAQSWWGNAWIKALEETSLDSKRLSRGRNYAKAGRVGAIAVTPGRLYADVYGSADMPYRTTVRVEQFTDQQWERFLAHIANRASHIAALLDHDMPQELIADAEDAEIPLLPSVGDLEPECDCQDWGFPCKHAAALCYQASWLLDADPFVLLLLRGRGQEELLIELRQHNVNLNAPHLAERPAPPTLATEVFAAELPELPQLAPPKDFHAPLIANIPGIDSAALTELATRAAHRAGELLRT